CFDWCRVLCLACFHLASEGCLKLFLGDNNRVLRFWFRDDLVVLRIASESAVEQASVATLSALRCWLCLLRLRRHGPELYEQPPYLLVEFRPMPPCDIGGQPTNQ